MVGPIYLPPQNQPRPFSLNPKSTSASPSQSQTPQRSSTSSTSAQYLPPRTQQQDQQRRPNNSYLPPNTGVDSRNSVPTPSKEYLPPREQQPNRQSQHQQSQHQQSQHQQSQHQLNQRHEQQSTQVASLPEYLPPNRANSFDSSTRGPTDINRIPQGNPTAPRQDYLPPARSGPSSYDRPSDSYLPPQQSQAPFVPSSSRTNSPVSGSGSAVFGADGYRYGGPGGRGSGPGARATAQAEQSTEAAKYDFEYRVSDEFGNDFAHKEMREGLRTQGSYSVVLPDGRKQIVSYEADEAGFRPRISYEAVASVLGAKPALASGVDSYSANGPASSRGYDYNANNVDSRIPY
ncbi:hypothetical protein QAD02_017766 [Eretmocerus hayati]|uniref:Uncharacterized protein n=1 Tax=Eretmocerus hayati TaxID=131215 RepID=A0ACC2PF99_9HYME|nr:hypothetical protein QAD02_017766 [Eretmocerus hayati]